jgi:hypothetical protein
MTTDFPQLEIGRKTGTEEFSWHQKPVDLDLLSFWRWAASDLVSNATRGVLAEFIVANALEITDGVRAEWEAFDLLTKEGLKIEVKSASYIQSWYHKNLSKITFSIQPTKAWDASTNESGSETRRQADVYVFCLLAHKNQKTLDPLNLDQWEFYVLPAATLNVACPTQKTIGFSSLLKLGAVKATYDEIAGCIARCSASR